MTKKTLARWTLGVVVFNAVFIFLLLLINTGPWHVIIDIPLPQEKRNGLFEALRAAAPAFILVPGAWLAHLYQRRLETIKQLRSIYGEFCDQFAKLRIFCETNPKSVEDFDLVSLKASLSSIVDKFRAVFLNIGESKNEQGEYPWEPLRSVFREASKLEKDQPVAQKQEVFRECEYLWRTVRYRLLDEMDRAKAINPESNRRPALEQKLKNPDQIRIPEETGDEK